MQGFKTEEKRIGEFTYRVTQLDAITGRGAFTRLMKVGGPAIAKLDEGVGAAFGELCTRLEVEDVHYFCDLFAKQTEVVQPDGKAPQLSDIFLFHFAGRYLEMMQWLTFAMKANFGSFFGGAGALVAQARAAASASSSPTE